LQKLLWRQKATLGDPDFFTGRSEEQKGEQSENFGFRAVALNCGRGEQ
jgi:hypothetical protein